MTYEELEAAAAVRGMRTVFHALNADLDASAAAEIRHVLMETLLAILDDVDELNDRIQALTAERDAAREQLERIGRKAFWAARPASAAGARS